MSFVQSTFLVLFLVTVALYFVRVDVRWQNRVLLVASVVFYGWLHWWWVALLWGTAAVDFLLSQLMVRSATHKRLWLALSVTSNLGLLFVFKYLGFCVDNVVAGLTALGFNPSVQTLNLILPAGISFYTFQSLSYTIDVYRGELRPRTRFETFLTYVSFFPQLMAGPIERAAHLLPQVEKARTWSSSNLRAGTGLVMWGLFKKVVIADTLAPYVDKVFLLDAPPASLMWAATTAFMLQIYADFSGYTDIARGTARILGIDLVRNFDEPYLAATTQEFWQRWHISLSTWIRDYLLAPLLGDANRVSPLRFGAAVTFTMVVMGLWHGAGWNFLLFGVFQATAIGFYAVVSRLLPARIKAIPGGRYAAAALHILVVGELGALFFRESSMAHILTQLTRVPWGGTVGEMAMALGLLGLCVIANIPFVIEHVARRTVLPWIPTHRAGLMVETTVWSMYVVAIAIAWNTDGADFVYFQF